jgi:nucleoside-diphosphate-sugar epimerase
MVHTTAERSIFAAVSAAAGPYRAGMTTGGRAARTVPGPPDPGGPVLVTGGTGFIGSHTVAALVAAGHRVRLLVRDPERVRPALEPHGCADRVEPVTGDVTDPGAVERAVAGCAAVVHAAAVYNLDARAYPEIGRTNVRGAETVLDAAGRHGCDPIVHVSSFVALLRRGATVTPDAPLSTVRTPYVRSKVDSEAVARRLARAGAPVVVVQPGATLGPHDPHVGDQARRLRDLLRGRYPMWPSGGMHTVDVRDVARVVAAALVPGRGPRSYLVPGHHVDARTMLDTLRAVTGRRLPVLVTPAALMLPITRLATAAQRVVPVHLPAEYEGVLTFASDTRCDDSAARTALGVRPRPLAETYRDAIRWLHSAGLLTDRQAGAAAEPLSSGTADGDRMDAG